ncbi:MAG: hypothetical protein ACK494_13340 [Planctomycetota bacterium]
MRNKKHFSAIRTLAACGFIVGLCLFLFFISTMLIPQFEIPYRLLKLKGLWNSLPSVNEDGFAIDDTMSEQFRHRDRLVDLGVFFNKTYSPDPKSNAFETHGQMFYALVKAIPDNHLWMLRLDNTLEVWDLKENEADWDLFAHRHSLSVHNLKNDTHSDNGSPPER